MRFSTLQALNPKVRALRPYRTLMKACGCETLIKPKDPEALVNHRRRPKKPSAVALPYLNLPKPTFLQGPYKFRFRVYNKTLQTSRFWQVKVHPSSDALVAFWDARGPGSISRVTTLDSSSSGGLGLGVEGSGFRV